MSAAIWSKCRFPPSEPPRRGSPPGYVGHVRSPVVPSSVFPPPRITEITYLTRLPHYAAQSLLAWLLTRSARRTRIHQRLDVAVESVCLSEIPSVRYPALAGDVSRSAAAPAPERFGCGTSSSATFSSAPAAPTPLGRTRPVQQRNSVTSVTSSGLL